MCRILFINSFLMSDKNISFKSATTNGYPETEQYIDDKYIQLKLK